MAKIHICTDCDKNGCVSPAEEEIWQTDECFFCGGENADCEYCKGKNYLPVFRCPIALAREVSSLMTYFLDWKISNRIVWPNGGTRLEQPLKLSRAFDLLNALFIKYESEMIKNAS